MMSTSHRHQPAACALTYFMHHVTGLLQERSYVRCLMIDFSKAFDVVRHVVLGVKLAQLKLPPSICSGLYLFLMVGLHRLKRHRLFPD